MSIRGWFFVTKIRFTLFATKINKNIELSFVFVQMNAAHCIGGQNKKYDNEYYSAVSFLWTRFYNNAAKIFGAEGVLRRRLRNREIMLGIQKVEDPVNQSLPLMCFYWINFSSREDYAEGCKILSIVSIVGIAVFDSFCLCKLWKERLLVSTKWLSTICQSFPLVGMEINSCSMARRIRP